MAEEAGGGDKTEEATDKKLNDAVRKGDTAVSREVAMLASLSAMLAGLAFVLTGATRDLVRSLYLIFDQAQGWRLDNGHDALELCMKAFGAAGLMLAPMAVLLTGFGLAASFAQARPRAVLNRIQPQLSRLSPAKGAKRLFGARGLVEFVKSVFKMSVAVWIVIGLMAGSLGQLASVPYMEPVLVPGLIASLSFRLLAGLCLAVLVIAAADIGFSRRFWLKNLMMTRQEVKDERKEMDGDPMVKARLRSLSRDRKRRRMIDGVPSATVVIANPTHFAVALRYSRQEAGAPVVVAKGQDLVALRIREAAEAHGVPVIEDKPLARALHKAVEVDQMIPPQFYQAVAGIISALSKAGA